MHRFQVRPRMPVYMAIGHNVQVYLSQNDALGPGRVPLGNYAPPLNYSLARCCEMLARN